MNSFHRSSPFISSCSLLGLLLLALLPVSAQTQNDVLRTRPRGNKPTLKPHTLAANEFLPASKLKAGMTGYGLTVFRGVKIERFGVTVLGVISKINNGKDMILVRFQGGPLTKRYAYGVQGMSGSPIYVNGRIIGAYAAGFAFAREPLGLVTPIEDMLEAWDPDLPQSPLATASAAAWLMGDQEVTLPVPVIVGGRRVTRVRWGGFGASRGERNADDGPDGHTATIVPLATPISVSGIAAGRLPALAKLLAPLGLQPMQVPGGATLPKGTKGSPLLPGGAVGVSLATGDLDFTAIGTLTYRRGNKVVAFGHPFTGLGPIDAPMSSAYIHDIWPSYQISFKMGAPVRVVGRVFQDRPFSVGGEIGARPVMVPIALDIDDRSTKRTRRFRAQVLRHPLLTPQIAAFAAANAIAELHGQPGDAMATVTLEVEAEEVGKVTRTNTFFDPISIGESATSDLQSLLATLTANPFYPIGIRSVKMKVVIEPRRDTAQIERIFLKQSRFEPGETIQVGVVIKPYKQERIVRNVEVRIPASITSGSLTLLVQGGGFAPLSLMTSPTGGLTVRSGSDASSASNIAQLVRRFVEREKNNDLVARLLLPTTAITVGGEKLTSLPPTIADVMRSTRSTGLRQERDEVKVVESSQYVLSGLQALTIRVAKKGASDPAVAPPAGAGEAGLTPSLPPPPSPVSVFGGEGEELIDIPAPDQNGFVPGAGQEEAALSGPDPLSVRAPIVGEQDSPADDGRSRPESSATFRDVVSSAARTQPVGRMPSLWQQSTAADFRAGALQGVSVTSLGDVRLAPTLRKIAESNETYFWALAPDGAGGVYAGTGDNGLVYHIDAKGALKEWAKTGELEVHTLARGANNTLYAGTSPHGRVFKIDAKGKPGLWFQTDEKYVLALALAPDGTLYAATGGGKGRVYRITPAGTGKVVYEGGESHVTALTLGPDGAVYAGTAPGGLVVKIAGANVAKPVVLYDAAESTISGLCVDGAGNVYAATGGRGVLYKIAPSATARVVFDKAPGPFAGLQIAADGTLWAASGPTVYAFLPDESVQTFDASSDIQILSLLLAPGGKLWASTGSVGAVYALGGGEKGEADATPSEGTLVSSVLDAKGMARWGTLRWSADVGPGANVLLETRSGDVAEPDATWSSWSRAYKHAGGEKVQSPPARYLQYRATLVGTQTASPRLRTVELFYLGRNQRPAIAITAPRVGEVLRGAHVLRWSGSDPDKDTLSYHVTLSADGGKTWRPVRSGRMPPERGSVSAGAGASPDRDPDARVEDELDKHDDIPADIRERLRNAPQEVRDALARSNQVGESKSAKAATNTGGTTRDTSLPFDTTRWPDGTYQLRVRASDAAANPQEALDAERVSGQFRIVNQPPVVVLFPKATTVLADRTARVEGSAAHRLVAVRAVQYRINNGDWIAAAAEDGLFDSPLEPFALTTAPLAPGTHTVEVQAQDEAGNAATQRTTVNVR